MKTMKKYEILKTTQTNVDGQRLYRIRALRSFDSVRKGQLGGYIAHERQLPQNGNSWVFATGRLLDNARICDDAKIYGTVSDRAYIYGKSVIGRGYLVMGSSRVVDSTLSTSGEYPDKGLNVPNIVEGSTRLVSCSLERCHVKNSQLTNCVTNDSIITGATFIKCRVARSHLLFDSFELHASLSLLDVHIDNDDHLIVFDKFGSMGRVTWAARNVAGEIVVRCGCFYGTLSEFRDAIRATHGKTQTAKAYLTIATLIAHRLGNTYLNTR